MQKKNVSLLPRKHITKKVKRGSPLGEDFTKKLVNDMEAIGCLEIMKAKS